MEKDQLDSLATVAVGSEKMPPPHSHYAPSEVYSASESPPAYSRPNVRSTSVQIASIIATTLIVISVIIGSFILASAWLQARASCSPESIAAMRVQMNLQQPQNEFIKPLQPEALIQDRDSVKESSQSLSESPLLGEKAETKAETKERKPEAEDGNSKTDNDNGDQQNNSEDDYDDSEFPPVHIKLPLQFDLDDLTKNFLAQARGSMSCIVETQKSGDVTNGDNENNATDRQRMLKLSGERVSIICESSDPRQEQQDQEVLTPIILPLGSVRIPLNPESGYNSYQVQNQYQVPEPQRVQMNVEERRINIPFPFNNIPSELRNIPLSMLSNSRIATQPHLMRPQPQIEVREMPIEIRHMQFDPMHAMKPTSEQDPFVREQQQPEMPQQNNPIIFENSNVMGGINPQAQNLHGMMPPPPPQWQDQRKQIVEPRLPLMINPMRGEERRLPETQESSDDISSNLREIPIELGRIFQQVPQEIRNIIQHITGQARPAQAPVPEGARREPFPEGMRPVPVDPFMLPIEVKNFLEHGNIEGTSRQGSQDAEEQQPNTKLFPATDEHNVEAEKKFPVPPNVMNIIRQVAGERPFPVRRFGIPMRLESMEFPVQAQAQVADNPPTEEDIQQPEERQNVSQTVHEEVPDEANRPHFVQPRSVRSVREETIHPRDKRVRRQV